MIVNFNEQNHRRPNNVKKKQEKKAKAIMLSDTTEMIFP